MQNGNRVPGPRPICKTFQPRVLVYPRRYARVAPSYDPTANARANPNRSYHVETTWEAMLLTAAYSGERKTFKRWSRE
jgi:hypothetical protein